MSHRGAVGSRRRASLIALCLAFVASCQGGKAAVQTALKDRQGQWSRQLDVLRGVQAELRSRFERAAPSGAPAAIALRARAVLDATDQSLVDIARQAGNVGDEVERALSRGEEAGAKALEERSPRVASALRGIEQQIEESGRDVARLEHGEVAKISGGAVPPKAL